MVAVKGAAPVLLAGWKPGLALAASSIGIFTKAWAYITRIIANAREIPMQFFSRTTVKPSSSTQANPFQHEDFNSVSLGQLHAHPMNPSGTSYEVADSTP